MLASRFTGRVDGPLEVAVEMLALLLRLVLGVVEAVSVSSLMIPRSENEGSGLDDESTRPNCHQR